jgi:ferredoxin/flavodoxin
MMEVVMTVRFSIAYISPNGSTRRVAEAIADQLLEAGEAAALVDLSKADESRPLIETMTSDDNTCLFIGSPVYNDVAVPPVMAAIDELPQSDDAWAVPFVTYGRASSGVALWQMAVALRDKGLLIAGAAKVAAVHSLMWQSDHPEGEGHPDADDLQQVRRLAGTVQSQLSAGTLTPMPPASLDYQPTELATEFKAKITQPWMHIPRTVDEQACNECGDCVKDCPVGAITLSPMPEFGDTCFDCFNCIRLCPENAIVPAFPIAAIEEVIRERVKNINEQPLSQVFLEGM